MGLCGILRSTPDTLIVTLQLGTRGEFPRMQEMQLEYGTNVATYTELLKQDMDRSEDLSDRPLNSLSTVDGLTLRAARLTSGYIIQLSSKKPLTVRTIFTGVGRINCVNTGRGGIVPFLSMVEWSESRPSDSGRTPDEQTMNLELPLSFPAEGYFKPDRLHYLVSPAVKPRHSSPRRHRNHGSRINWKEIFRVAGKVRPHLYFWRFKMHCYIIRRRSSHRYP